MSTMPDVPTTEAEFAELAERHRRELHVHCYRMLGSFEEAEDLVQETLLRAWRGRETLERDEWFRAWLYKIATNACLDAIKRGRAARAVARLVPGRAVAAALPGPAARRGRRRRPTSPTRRSSRARRSSSRSSP